MFLAIVTILLVTAICGPILHQRTLTSAERAELTAQQWHVAGRRWGLLVFWTWCLACGLVLAICLYGLAKIA